jgi:tail-anchored protein insertion receptor
MNTGRFLATNGFKMYVQWSYAKVPMYWLPKGWLPWYGEWILSFPRAPTGAVSIQVWQFACAAVIGVVFDAVKGVMTMIWETRAKAQEEKVKLKVEKMK